MLPSMPDLDGDAIGDVVVSSRQKPVVFALSGKSGRLLWHRMDPRSALPERLFQSPSGPSYPNAPLNTWGRPVGQPLVFAGPSGPVLVVTLDFGLIEGDYSRVLGVEAVVLSASRDSTRGPAARSGIETRIVMVIRRSRPKRCVWLATRSWASFRQETG